jgi:hypothetical protein
VHKLRCSHVRLIRTPSSYRVHDYNLALTREELISIGGDPTDWILFDKLFDLIEKEAEKIGNSTGESGTEVSTDRG